MIEQWSRQLSQLSGTLTSNEVMPQRLVDELLSEDASLRERVRLVEVDFPHLEGILDRIEGLHILAGLQRFGTDDCLTVFRAIRFPTYKRLFAMLYEQGCSIINYEQARLLELYQDASYVRKRNEIRADHLFWKQPQERIVKGLPVFHLANDALQIHRSFRGSADKVVIIAIHLPYALLRNQQVRVFTNTAADLEFDWSDSDFEVTSFVQKEARYEIDFGALRSRGIDLYEMSLQGLPYAINEMATMGIGQDFFLLDIHEVVNKEPMTVLFAETDVLKDNEFFLHGFFGDQNLFGRRMTEYLPHKCHRIETT